MWMDSYTLFPRKNGSEKVAPIVFFTMPIRNQSEFARVCRDVSGTYKEGGAQGFCDSLLPVVGGKNTHAKTFPSPLLLHCENAPPIRFVIEFGASGP